MPAIGLEIYTTLRSGTSSGGAFKAGEIIFRQGDDAREEAYVVHEGSVEIRTSVDGEARVLGHHKEGDLFGECALFRKAPARPMLSRSADVELLIIQNERLDWLDPQPPALTIELLRRLSEWVVMSDRDRAGAQTR